MLNIELKKSNLKNKRYMVLINNKKIHFGDSRYQNYTMHKDNERRRLYILRHKKNEDWNLKGINTAGFWSYWLLWHKKKLDDSIKYLNKKFKINIIKNI